ncbi:MAG: hypothetical protein E3K37_13185 [Candidatus Kuenenia sp.]|nr:hypothetical protein [Candidatus Kuenenia hertensis]
MKSIVNGSSICIVTLFLLFSGGNLLYGQSEHQVVQESKDLHIVPEETTSLMALKGITQIIEEVEEQITNKKNELAGAADQEQKTEIVKEIDKLKERLDSLRENFEEIATGLDREVFDTKPQKRFDWKEEVQVLVGPIINEMKSITARPRLIESLRTQVTYNEKKIQFIKNALRNIQELIAHVKDERLKRQLIALEREWYDKGKQVSTQLTIAKYQLTEKENEKKSLLESGQKLAKVFFKSRGKNFIFSAIAFFLVFFLLRYIHKHIYRSSSVYRAAKRSFYVRLADVFYHIATFVGSTSALLIVLYVSGDWVLLGLAFILIFGLIWTAKQTLPRFYEQCKLLLNVGTVRENERVIYHGLPWRVASLNLYSYLVNPELKGGMIRLPIRELEGLRSRPFHQDEPWFPCKENDWVILADGTLGKVVIQTPEIVKILVVGGSDKTYSTVEFLQQKPTNISTVFCLHVTFGVDYQHQPICTSEIPDILKEIISKELSKSGYENDINSIVVEFKEAGSSSLNYSILATFSGRVAKDYYKLSRTIQKIAVDTCNKYGWIIPFTQITLHTTPAKNINSGKEEKAH